MPILARSLAMCCMPTITKTWLLLSAITRLKDRCVLRLAVTTAVEHKELQEQLTRTLDQLQAAQQSKQEQQARQAALDQQV